MKMTGKKTRFANVKAVGLAIAMAMTTSVSTVAVAKYAVPTQNMSLVKVHVKGMVCDFCARGLEKVFYKQPAVKHIDVNLKNSLVKIQLKPNQNLTDTEITKLVKDNGISVVNIER